MKRNQSLISFDESQAFRLSIRRPTVKPSDFEFTQAMMSQSESEQLLRAGTPLPLPLVRQPSLFSPSPKGSFSLLQPLSARSPSSSPLESDKSTGSSRTSSRRSSIEDVEVYVVIKTNGSTDMVFLDSDDDNEDDFLGDVDPIGRGAEGTIYPVQAWAKGDEKSVVIKQTRSDKPSKGCLIHQELTAEHESSCDHNILKLIRMKKKASVINLALPYCELFLDKAMIEFEKTTTPTFDAYLKNAMLAQVASDILEALRYMHTFVHKNGVGYVHRDLKPANIAMKYSDGGWHAVLCDLDTAEEMNGKAQQAGTLPFMHPACFIEKNADLTSENDLYQLGVTLLVMLGKSQSVLPPETLSGQMAVMEWKGNKYLHESAAYETAKKAARIVEMEALRKPIALAKLRTSSGLYHVNLVRSLNPKVYSTLTKDLEHCTTIEDTLTTVAMHLTRCFEQPKIKELEDALAKIRTLMIQNYPQGQGTFHQDLECFYETLSGSAKPLKHTTSSFFRDYSRTPTPPTLSSEGSGRFVRTEPFF